MDLKSSANELARGMGADLVGIAGIDRYATTPRRYHPATLLPQTHSVISIGVKILDGVIEPQQALVENLPYQVFGYGWLSHVKLNEIAYELARFLERAGHISLPFPSFGSSMIDPAAQGQNQGVSLSNRHAAVAAGLARFGWSNLAITPQFGPRQRFVTLLTSAPLEPDELLSPLSEPRCQGCSVCVESCPGGAIHRSEEVTFQLEDETVRMASLNKPLCAWYNVGLSSKTFGNVDIAIPETISREAIREGQATAERLEPYRAARRVITLSGSGYCGMCLVSCPLGNPEQRTQAGG